MKFADQIPDKTKKKLNKITLPKKKRKKRKAEANPNTKKKKEEKLSFRDWQDIMGMNRDVYVRRNGAVKRK